MNVLEEKFVKRPNTHQTHFEDLVLLGSDGLDELNDKVEKFMSTMQNKDVGMNLTTKVDGSPALIIYNKVSKKDSIPLGWNMNCSQIKY